MRRINIKRFFITLLIIFLLFLVSALIVGIVICNSFSREIDLTLIKSSKTSVTKIYYYDFEDRKNRVGTPCELKEEALFINKSEWYSFYDLPQDLIDAFVAIEDKRFYEHNGIDVGRTLKAAFNYAFKFNSSGFGGSTITQQLVKNLTGDDSVTAARKFEEIFRAINLESRLSKNEILEIYLNVVYLSENCYGVGSAASAYFGKEINDLTLAECASLAAIVKSPAKYDPYKNPENNLARRNVVLKEMYSQGYINEEEYNNAINEEQNINENIDNETKSGIFSWYTETLINDIANDLSEKYDLNLSSAKMMILKGGLNIYSVIDPKIQQIATEVYENYKEYIPGQLGEYPESACVIIDPYTSDLLAIVGGTGKKSANMILNRATDTKRAPGSVIKPLSVYGPSLEEGVINYATVFDDTPINIGNDSVWPKNSPDRYRGLMPVSYALAHSVNTVAVKLLNKLSVDKSFDYLTNKFNLEIDKINDKSPSPLALGQLTNGESLLNITNAYSAFANGGNLSSVKTYLYVTDSDGNVILSRDDKSEKILSKETADIMTLMLKGVVTDGTAKSININNIAVAGKTGTSGNSYDKWFVGYTPEYLCGVWMGFDMPKSITSQKNSSCTVFNAIMNAIYSEVVADIDFNISGNIVEVEFCKDSGKLAGNECRCDIRGNRAEKGYFVKGTEPSEICDLHLGEYIDIEDGLIASESTPNYRKRRVSLLNYDRDESTLYYVQDENCLYKNRKRK